MGGTPPRDLSVARVLRAVRAALRLFLAPHEAGRALLDDLRDALCDPYPRADKRSRDYPRKKRERPPGRPKVVTATRKQRLRAQELKAKLRNKG